MATIDLLELPATGALLCIDPGTRTLGLAACDADHLVASPIGTIKRRKLADDLQAVFAHFDERACIGIVIGLPLNMDGSAGPRAQSVRTFARNLISYRDVPVAFQDERLSTAEAERAMIEADLSRARRKESIDASAAAVILQTAMDRLRSAR